MTITEQDRAAFERSIREQPEDDTRRLAFADWLDEHGEPERAEFVRLGCRIEAWGCTFAQTKEQPGWKHNCGTNENGYWLCQPLRGRERDLLDRHWSKWIRASGVVPAGWNLSTDGGTFHVWRDEPFDGGFRFAFARGFVDEVRLPCAAFLEHAAAIFAHPVTKVVLTDADPFDEEDVPDPGFRWHGDHDWLGENAGGGTPTSAMGGLPREIVKLMPYRRRFRGADKYLERVGEGGLVRTYRTRKEALAVLSAACVAYGRKLAGLPALAGATA